MKHYFEYLENRIRGAWHKPVLSDYGKEDFCGHDIAQNIMSLHLLFRKAGFDKGFKAALYGNNSARWAMACMAVNTYTGVAVPILSEFLHEDASALVNHSESGVLFVQKHTWAEMDPSSMPGLRLVISLEDFYVLYSETGYEGPLLEAVSLEYETAFPYGLSAGQIHFDVCGLDELAVINYTSGTTSAPKGVMLTYANFNTNICYALDHIPPHTGDKIVSMLPLAHMYGFMFEFLYPLCGGVRVYFLGKTPTPALLLKAMKNVRPYLFITVPLVMEKIFKKSIQPVVSRPVMRLLMALPGISSLICGKIRRSLMDALGGNLYQIVMGGAALNPEVEKWFKKIGLPYTVGYGMTEAAPLLAYSGWENYAMGSCGRAADRCEVRIDSMDPQHKAGEIQARGMNIMKGYYKNETATSAAFTQDGWLRTGDLGIQDTFGNIFIRGRIKNMILSSNGQNIYPEEIEAVINSLPNVQESVVVSRGKKLTALIYTGENGTGFSDEDLQSVNARLPVYERISSVEIVSQPFQKTPKQSIKRFMYA